MIASAHAATPRLDLRARPGLSTGDDLQDPQRCDRASDDRRGAHASNDGVTVLGVVQGKLAPLGASGAPGQRLRAAKASDYAREPGPCMLMPAIA